jgi:lipopolysaccharide transport system permease protein
MTQSGFMNHKQANNEWDMVIESDKSLLSINFIDIWRYRDLLLLLVRRDFVAFYKQTILGPLWFFIQPLFTTIIFVFVFGNLAGISTNGLPQPLFYLTGIISWNYFADCLTKTSTVFRDNASIFGKVYFPRLIMPLSIVVSNLVKFGVQFILLVFSMLYFVVFREFKPEIGWSVLLLPAFILEMAALGLGLGMIISALTTKYRDLSFLVTFGVQLLMYATPVIYPLSSAPQEYKHIISLNPMSPIIEGIRYILLGRGDLTLYSLATSFIATSIFLFAGVVIFNRVEKNFVDTI